MSDLREIAEAFTAQNKSLSSIEEHVARIDGHMVQLRERSHDLANHIGAVALQGGAQAAALEGHTKAIKQLQNEVASLGDLMRRQHSETLAALASLGARVRTEAELMETQQRG